MAIAGATFTVVIICNGTVGGRACNRWPFVAGAAGGDAVETCCWCANLCNTNALSAVGSGAVGLHAERSCGAEACVEGGSACGRRVSISVELELVVAVLPAPRWIVRP